MPGNVIEITGYEVVVRTAAAHGASGSPLILKTREDPKLIGVVAEAKMVGLPSHPSEAEYRNKNMAILISLVKDILGSEQMKKQYADRFIGVVGFKQFTS